MQGKYKPLFRYVQHKIARSLKKKQSVLLLGPRQTGKTTLAVEVLKGIKNVEEYSLQDPSVRLEIEKDPSIIIRRARASGKVCLFIDEAQKVPEVFDALQVLIDKKEANCIVTGSSARKLRRKGVNLLPGRIKYFHLDPLIWAEMGMSKGAEISILAAANINHKIGYGIEECMVYGCLPAVTALKEKERPEFLKSYSKIYLEEEIRAEALSRNIGAFSRFLELAAAESGTSPNFTKLSNESGVSQPSIKEYFKILEDTLVTERVDPYIKNSRKRLLSTPKYYFFDIGVRNAIARLPLKAELINSQKGALFEHAVILELIRRIRACGQDHKVCFWRTSGGAEVDCVIDMGGKVIPIEIKASAHVSLSELKGLKSFLADYSNLADKGYVITMGRKKELLAKNIIAVPWFLF